MKRRRYHAWPPDRVSSIGSVGRSSPIPFHPLSPPSIMAKLSTFLLLLVLGCSLLGIGDAFAKPQSEARQLYDRVMEEFQQKEYEAARAGFELFLSLHGDSNYAGSAQFWIGECYYRMSQLQDAMTAFQKVLSHYPHSVKTAGATLKIGLIYKKLGQPDPSRILLERVIITFPQSQEAEVARKTLRR